MRCESVRGGCGGVGCRGIQGQRDLLLQHDDRLVGDDDQSVELFAYALVGDLTLRGSRGAVDRDRQQLLRGREPLALGFGEVGVLEAPRFAFGDVEGDLVVGDRSRVGRELLIGQVRLG